jgi:hypothetical protein
VYFIAITVIAEAAIAAKATNVVMYQNQYGNIIAGSGYRRRARSHRRRPMLP